MVPHNDDFRLEAEDQLHFCGELNQAKVYAKHFGLDLLTHEGKGKSELTFDDQQLVDVAQLETARKDKGQHHRTFVQVQSSRGGSQ